MNTEKFEVKINVEWQPIETAPWGRVVLLTGDSGYRAPHDRFVCNGYREHDWHQEQFNTVQGNPLGDFGMVPTHWMPMLRLPGDQS